MKTFFRFVFQGLILLIVAMVSALTAMRFAIHGREVAVPDMVSKSPQEARKLAEQDGFQVEVERQYFSSAVPEGKILSQSPSAGTKVRRGWDIRLAVSLGQQRVDIPSVVGQSERAAEMNIRRRGLDLGPLAQVQLSGTPAQQVLSQSPPANASGVLAPKISLLVAAAPPSPAFVMPSFLGQTITSATPAIESAGLHVGTVSMAGQTTEGNAAATASTPRLAAGSVIVSQGPAAGEKVGIGTSVNFQVQ